MDKMPDGNTAALRQFEAAQDKANAIYECYGRRVEDAFVEDMLCGRTVKINGHNYNAQDFVNGYVGPCPAVDEFVSAEDVCLLLLAREDVRERLNKKLAGYIRDWLTTSAIASDWVDERCRDWNEDDRQRHGEPA